MATQNSISRPMVPLGAAQSIDAPQGLLEKAQAFYTGNTPEVVQQSMSNLLSLGKLFGLGDPGAAYAGGAGAATSALAPGRVEQVVERVADALPEWAKKLGGLAKPAESVTALAKKLKLTDLGDIVPEAEFTGRGWLGPNGELIDIGKNLHRDTMLDATKGGSANYPLMGGHKNLQRVGSYNSFEILSPPTDAQLQQMSKFEKIFGPAIWDITDPISKKLVATGKGIRNIRAELESNPKAADWLKRFVGLGVGAGVAAEAAQEMKQPAPPARKIGPYASSHYNGQEEF